MLNSTAQTIVHLFNSKSCRLLDKSDSRYASDVLAVWSINDDFAVKLLTNGHLKYEPYKAPTYSQYLYTIKEVDELINYFN